MRYICITASVQNHSVRNFAAYANVRAGFCARQLEILQLRVARFGVMRATLYTKFHT